jgi:hypothetical protein
MGEGDGMPDRIIQPVVYVGDPRYSFQGNTPAEILRIVWFEKPGTIIRRLCLHLKYPDGQSDYTPLTEAVDRGWLKPVPDGRGFDHALILSDWLEGQDDGRRLTLTEVAALLREGFGRKGRP